MFHMRLTWFFAALILSALLALLEGWAVENFIFWRLEWFDVPMHYLGGLTLGTFAVAFWHRHRPTVFALSLIVAFVAWEVFEYIFGLPREANYAFDTALDLVMDTLGALTAYGIARISLWKKA